MKEIRLDAAVVGAGTAGLFAAARISHKTEKFLVFEGGIEGTTCARVGCMPSKAVIALGRAFATASGQMGNSGAGGSKAADTEAVLARVREMRDGLYKSTAANARARFGDKIVNETVSFAEPMILTGAETRYVCGAIVAATGSTPAVPPGWRLSPGKIVTTDTFFELPRLPERVLAVGAGPVGVELAQAMAHLGLSVTLVEMTERVAAVSDPDVEKAVKEMLAGEKNLACRFQTAARLDSENGGPVLVTLTDRATGKSERAEFDLVLLASGRRPNVEALRLENSGLALDGRGFPRIDPKTLKADGQNVFFAGDASAIRPFYHDAADQGMLAGVNAVAGGDLSTLPERVPLAIVFTDPNVAMVGAGPASLPPEGFVTGRADASRSGRGIVEGGKQGLMSLYFAKADGRLLGAQMAMPAGEHLAHYLSVMISGRFTVDDVLALPFYHPTYEELVKSAVEDARRALR